MFKFNTLILNGNDNYVDNNPEIFKEENINICSNNHIKPKKRKNSNDIKEELINDTEKKEINEDYGYLKGPNGENKKVIKNIKPSANIPIEREEEKEFSFNKVKKNEKQNPLKKINSIKE